MCITNSLIIYREIQGKKVSHKEFLESLILELLGGPKKKYKTKHHCPEYIDPNQKGKGKGRCRMKDCPGKPCWKCSVCSIGEKKVYLCIPNCWRKYHENL